MPIELGSVRAALAGRYDIERELGAGGMAVVYLAEDVRHGRQVAVKVLRPEVAASLGAERFLREIQIAAGLTHPHILPLHDSGQADGFLYYVMPYIEGETLRDRLRREGVLSMADVQQITGEVAEALEYAHQQGLVHRDIKPENILLSGGHAVVADFGMARALEQSGGEKLTRSGLAVGTPGYSSPEQTFADGPLDGRTDVFSLGVVAYEMLSGDRPFTGSSARAIFARMTTETPTSLRALRDSVSEEAETAVMRALAKLPADRFATPGDFARALRGGTAAARGVRQVGFTDRVADALKRSSAFNRAAGAVVTILLLGAAALLWPAIRQATGGTARTGGPSELEAGVLPIPAGPRVAVLPFANVAGDTSKESLLQLIHEEVMSKLGEAGDVSVINSASISRFSVADFTSPEIGRALQANAVVETAITLLRDSVHLEVRALEPDSERLLWTERYSSGTADSAYLAIRVPELIATGLRRALDPEAEIGPPPVHEPTPAALAAYLRGVQLQQETARSRREGDGERAIKSFLRAVRLEPKYAEAWAALGTAWEYSGGWFGWRSPHDAMPEAHKAYERAIELDSTLAEAHLGLGTINFRYFWDWEKAERELRRAIRANPSLAMARDQYGNFLRAMNRTDEGVVQLEAAVQLDPFGVHWAELRQHYMELGRVDEAEEAGRKAKELDPDGVAAGFSYALNLFTEGKMREAADSMAAAGIPGFAAWMYAVGGFEDEARQLLSELEGESNVSHQPIANAYVTLGDTAKALDVLEAGLEERAAHMVWLNKQSLDPDEESPGLSPAFPDIDLGGEPRFQAILERLNFPKPASEPD